MKATDDNAAGRSGRAGSGGAPTLAALGGWRALIDNPGLILTTLRRGLTVGQDSLGNRYFEERHPTRPDGRARRWVIYAGRARDASLVPAEWHAWLHFTTDAPLPAPQTQTAPVAPLQAPQAQGLPAPQAQGLPAPDLPGGGAASAGLAAGGLALPPAGEAAPPVATPDAPAEVKPIWDRRAVAVLDVLDKEDGAVHRLRVPVGSSVSEGKLSIAIGACVVRPADMTPDAAIFITVTSSTVSADAASSDGAPLFRGWLIRSEPGATVVGNAAVTMRLIGCTGRTG